MHASGTIWRARILGVLLAVFITAAPIIYYRMTYTGTKRLRVVTAGKMYRAGCMTAGGLESAIRKYNIRTVLNLMEEAPDPELPRGYFRRQREKESEICRRNGARYVTMHVKLVPIKQSRQRRPDTIERYLELLDDPASYPLLVHCKAGLHRTGVLIGIYRMEYEGWSRHQALKEIRRNGFGTFNSSAANEYISQYILQYRPHQRPGRVVERMPGPRSAPGRLTSRPVELPEAYRELPE